MSEPNDVPEPNWLELWSGRRLVMSGARRDVSPQEIDQYVRRHLPDETFLVIFRARWRVYMAWEVTPSFGRPPRWEVLQGDRCRALETTHAIGRPAPATRGGAA